ncbi:hypothetical protein L6R49_21435 [Myxococcota bacterium]|nr:hypothetical protein [Myxococcota bacterium]
MLFVLLFACIGDTGSEPYSGPNPCFEDRVAVGAEDTPLGFSAADVVEVMQANPSTTMSWDYAIFDIGTKVKVTVEGQDGEASLISVPGGEKCTSLPAELLAVPTEFTVSVADGGLVSTFTEEVFAEAATPEGVQLWDSETGQYWTMSVDTALDAQIRDWLLAEEGVTSDPEVVLWFGGARTTWEDGRLGIEILAGDAGIRAWDGSWSL